MKNILKKTPNLRAKSKSNTFMAFDKNKVVVWVDNNQKKPKLSIGQKVIRLSIKYPSGSIAILFWNGKNYDFARINENYLSNKPVSENHLQNFVKDVSHVYSRVASSKGDNAYLDSIIETVNPANIKWLETATNEDILTLANTFKDKFNVNLNDKVTTLATYTDTLFQIFNPQSNGKTYKETTLFLPLSEDWFNSSALLKEYYQKVWISNGELNRFIGGSGEGVYVDSQLVEIKSALLKLKDFVSETAVSNTSEGLWLASLTAENLSTISRMIFISTNTWHYDYTQKYAEGIALVNTVGIIQVPPLLTVLIHEMNVNRFSMPFFPRDTHIPDYDTEDIWTKPQNKAEFRQKVLTDIESIDKLYQSSCFINALILSLILSLK